MGASSLFRSSVTIVRPKRTTTGGEVKYDYDAATARSVTFWAGAAAGSDWDTPGNAAGEPDSTNTTATTALAPFAQTGTLALSDYDFSDLPDDAVISAVSVVAHVAHDHTAARSWVVTIKDAVGDALGGVVSAFDAVPAGADHADETVVAAAGWASAAATKAALVAGVASVECIGIGDSEVSVEWAADAVGVRVTYTAASEGATSTTGVRCEIQASRSAEAVEFARVTGRTRYTGWFPASQDIRLADRVLWTPRVGTQKTLEVKSPPRDPTGIGDHVEVELEEVV